MATTVDLRLLRTQLDRVLAAIEERSGSTVEIDGDHYWLVESRDLFDLTKVPTPGVGQISDDAQELQAMAERSPEDLTPWHDLKHLAGLLEALAARDLPG